MEIVRIVNFFFFLLVLVFLRSRTYPATKKINLLTMLIKRPSC